MIVFCDIVHFRTVLQLLFTPNVVPSSPIPVTLMIEAIRSPKRRFLQDPHGRTSQKSAFLIITAVKISYNLVEIYQRFGRIYCSLLHGRIVYPAHK
jgi:hypothetical protein